MSKSMHEIDDKPGFRLPFRKQEQVSVSTPKPAPKASEPRSTSGTTRLALRIILGGALLAATLFTIWTPSSLLSESLQEKMARALAANGKNSLTQAAETGLPEASQAIKSASWSGTAEMTAGRYARTA